VEFLFLGYTPQNLMDDFWHPRPEQVFGLVPIYYRFGTQQRIGKELAGHSLHHLGYHALLL